MMDKENPLEELNRILKRVQEQLNDLPVPTEKRYIRMSDGSTITNDPDFYKALKKDK